MADEKFFEKAVVAEKLREAAEDAEVVRVANLLDAEYEDHVEKWDPTKMSELSWAVRLDKCPYSPNVSHIVFLHRVGACLAKRHPGVFFDVRFDTLYRLALRVTLYRKKTEMLNKSE